MASTSTRIGFLQFAFFTGLAAILARAVQLQVVEGERWRTVAESTRTRTRELPARRGTIYDRNGAQLAVSQEYYRVGVATWEVPAARRELVARVLTREIGMEAARVRRAFRAPDRDRIYLYRYAPSSASEVEAIRRVRGVRLERIYLRAHPSGGVARDLVGFVDGETGRGRAGLEQALDRWLAGTPGLATFLRDRRGTLYQSPDRIVRPPVPGHDVYLTIDAELQGIAEAGLAEQLEEQKADAGDVVLLDPRRGEILALATIVRRAAGARRAGGWIPAEPGSTIKPFAAAGLLALGRARADDSVHGERGTYQLPKRRRPIRDDHPLPGYLTLARAIEVSSNVATVKFTARLRPEEHYDLLRDFGFGSPTGVELPYESGGILRRPEQWRVDNTQPSMAQGYEIEVTPLQLAAAYAALANDGLLPALTLIREVRGADGEPVRQHRPAPVRRVISSEVAAEVRSFLNLAAGTTGTGSRAQLDRFRVLGKTGTARNVVDGQYTNTYTSSFAGIFPAEDPQLVAVVRIVNPGGGEYYGGLVAAPLLRRMLMEALAARQSALDRRRLADGRAPLPELSPAPEAPPARQQIRFPVVQRTEPAAPPRVVLPDVRGLSVRQAVLQIHRRGFRVRLEGMGIVRRMEPAAGDSLATGGVVTLTAEEGGP